MSIYLNINPFFEFLDKFNIIPLAFSLIISLNLNQLSNSFIETIIAPIMNRLFNDSNIKLRNREVTIFGITFQFGQFLVHLIQFIFTLITLYFIYVFYVYVSSKNININNESQSDILFASSSNKKLNT